MGIMLKSEKEHLKEDRKIYPPFLVEGFKKIREEIRAEEETGKTIPYKRKKLADFIQLFRAIWIISSKVYQEKYWIQQQPPIVGDNYMETMETFLSDGEGVLEANDARRISMTPKQREMLQKLYNMVEDFELAEDTPEDPGHGVNDAEIISHPKWHQIQDYAKLVYEELSGDDLNAWEKSKPK